jgi:UDP-N-acetylglucosamine--N-acetylmuramyl-(pentapeptide) pyrophosphoryl-undecaprenol N-acetylglucosamine transferase
MKMNNIKNRIKSGKRILITGGGTGGHLYPATAIIEYLKNHYPGINLLFIGPYTGMGQKLIPGLGINFKMIKARGLSRGKNNFIRTVNMIKFTAGLIPGFLRSIGIIRKFKPDIILGMGGYICAPVLLAAIAMKIDYALHEQNYLPGRANRFFVRWARYIFISFKDTSGYLKIGKGKAIFSGNPVRRSVVELDSVKPDYEKWGLTPGHFTVVAFGGSLGAEKINREFMKLYDYFTNDDKIQFILICGDRFYKVLEKERDLLENKRKKIVFKIFPYIDEMQQIYRIADLVVARAGANTIFELIAANIPSILIPYPLAVDDHQYYNARFLEDRGKALLIRDDDLVSDLLYDSINGLMADNMRKIKNMKNARMGMEKISSAEIITGYLIGDKIEKKDR